MEESNGRTETQYLGMLLSSFLSWLGMGCWKETYILHLSSTTVKYQTKN